MNDAADTQSKPVIDSAEALAHALGGARGNGRGWMALCPAHDDQTPSLAINESSDRKILFKCQSRGCSQVEVIAALRERRLWPFAKRSGSTPRTAQPNGNAPIEPDPRAVKLWRRSVASSGTKVEAYLRARGLTIDPPQSLRFCSQYIYWPGEGAPSIVVPAMVAAIQAPDRRVIAVQATALHPKADRKFTDKNARRIHGAQGAGAVRLAAAGEVLGLAEGVEDAIGAIQITQVPCWAALGAARMDRVEVPVTVKEIHIFADDDEAGDYSAKRTATLHQAVGRRVFIRRPPAGIKDWAAFAEQRTVTSREA